MDKLSLSNDYLFFKFLLRSDLPWQKLVTYKIIIYLHGEGSKYFTSDFQFKTLHLDMDTQIKSLVLLVDHTCDATAHIGFESVLQLTTYNVNTERKAANFERKFFLKTF